jgi:hypothetical protein
MAKQQEIVRASPEFKKLLRDIKIDRVKLGLNKELLSDRRLTRAITRIPNIRDVLVKWRIDDNKE